MENQLVKARAGQITRAVEQVAQDEAIDKERLRGLVASGKVVVSRITGTSTSPLKVSAKTSPLK